MQLIVLLVVTALFFALYNVFLKVASGGIQQMLGAIILQITAALIGAIAILYLKGTNTVFNYTKEGVTYAVLSGVFVGLAEILSFYIFSKNVNASVGIPIIIGGTIFFSVIIGIIFLKEKIAIYDVLGLFLILTGVSIILIFKK
jgi:transporter family protein